MSSGHLVVHRQFGGERSANTLLIVIIAQICVEKVGEGIVEKCDRPCDKTKYTWRRIDYNQIVLEQFHCLI